MSFQYNSGNNKYYKCNITCARCTARKKNSTEQCKKNTCMYLPYCYVHSRILLNLVVKQSTIENAGLGLFTLKDFKKNENICNYEGEIIDDKELVNRYGKNNLAPYTIKLANNKYIDCACKRSQGAYINSFRGGSGNNARFIINNKYDRVRLQATRNIKSGQEIFVSYGSNYFKKEVHVSSHKTLKYKLRI